VAAAERWPRDGEPENRVGWLVTVARRRAIDRSRRERALAEKLALLDEPVTMGESNLADERLELIFTCCHPALSREAQVALTLRALGGLTVAEIASAFLVAPETMKRRVTRAKTKIALGLGEGRRGARDPADRAGCIRIPSGDRVIAAGDAGRLAAGRRPVRGAGGVHGLARGRAQPRRGDRRGRRRGGGAGSWSGAAQRSPGRSPQAGSGGSREPLRFITARSDGPNRT
jgi:hypothetical protein